MYIPDGEYIVKKAFKSLQANSSIISSNNAWLVIPEGINATLFHVRNGCYIKVNINGNALGRKSNSYGIASSRSLKLEGCVIDGCKFKGLQFGIRLVGANSTIIRNSFFYDMENSGVIIEAVDGTPCNNNIITGNYFENMGDVAAAFFSQNDTPYSTEISHNIISNNVARNTQRITMGYAFDFETSGIANKFGNIFIGNTVEQTIKFDYAQNGFVFANCKGGVIANNTYKGLDKSVSGANIGISVIHSDDVVVEGNYISDCGAGIVVGRSSNISISNNSLVDCGRTSFTFAAISLRPGYVLGKQSYENIKVQGNSIVFKDKIDDRGTVGISTYIYNTDTSSGDNEYKNISILDNTVQDYGENGVCIMGHTDNFVKDVVISGNNFSTSSLLATNNAAIRFNKVSYAQVRGNTLIDPGVLGIRATEINTLVVDSNTIKKDIVEDRLTYYMIHPGSDSTSIVTNNYFEGLTQGGLLTVGGLDSTIQNNIGYKTEARGTVLDVVSGEVVRHGLTKAAINTQLTPTTADVVSFYAEKVDSRSFKIFYTLKDESLLTTASFEWVATA